VSTVWDKRTPISSRELNWSVICEIAVVTMVLSRAMQNTAKHNVIYFQKSKELLLYRGSSIEINFDGVVAIAAASFEVVFFGAFPLSLVKGFSL
jgi:hypothetical protein